jgi:hypothetical protein
MNRRMLSLYLISLSISAPLYVDGIATAQSTSPAQTNPLPRIAQQWVDELKKPGYAASTCMLSPVFASDGMTVAVSADRVFLAGDMVVAVGDEKVDATAKRPVTDLLMKHGASESVPIRIRRADKELVVTIACIDRKAFFDLLLEAAFAASKNDAATCADKITAARNVHFLSAVVRDFAYECAVAARRIVGIPNQAQAAYEINRELILENEWSTDSLDRIRGRILSVVDRLRKHDNSLLGDDLMQIYDRAVAAKSPTTAAMTSR